MLLLALEDFVPVLLSAAGLATLAKLATKIDRRAGQWCRLALLLIPVGGVTKPVYKTVLALSNGDVDLTLLDELLFWFLAPGFVALSIGVSRARRIWTDSAPATATWVALASMAVLIGSAAMALTGSEAWFPLLLAMTTLANIWAITLLVGWSRRVSDLLAALLFAVSLGIAISLAGAAAALQQTIPVQWGEQLASTASQGLFLWGSLRLAAKVSIPARPVPTARRANLG